MTTVVYRNGKPSRARRAGTTKPHKNTNIRLIEKQAAGFHVGEYLYLFGPEVDPPAIGSFLVDRLIMTRNEDDLPVVILWCIQYGDGSRYRFMFLRDDLVHRIAPTPVAYIIRETEEPCLS